MADVWLCKACVTLHMAYGGLCLACMGIHSTCVGLCRADMVLILMVWCCVGLIWGYVWLMLCYVGPF